MTREEVYKLIDGERDYQELRWGSTPSKGKHSPTEFLVYMQDYLTQAIHQVSRQGEPMATVDCLDTLRKITTIGVACMEQHGAPARE